MFALFFSLYMSMFAGTWHMWTLSEIRTLTKTSVAELGTLITSVFGDVQMTNFGNTILESQYIPDVGYYYPYMGIIGFVLALITSIGIVVLSVKGIKKAFSVFFMLFR